MDQNHTDSANRETATTEEKTMLKGLSDVEAVLKKWLDGSLAKEYAVKPHQYRIILHLKLDAVVKLQRGPVVQIHLLWPDVQPNIKTIMRRTFEQITNRKLVDGLAIEQSMIVTKRSSNYRKWLREKFGDEADILPDLLPMRRLRKQTSTEVTVTLTDRATGLQVSVSSNTIPQWDLEREARYRLSRIVRNHEDEHANRGVDPNDPSTAGRAEVVDAAHAAGEGEAGQHEGGTGGDSTALLLASHYARIEQHCFEMSGGANFARTFFA